MLCCGGLGYYVPILTAILDLCGCNPFYLVVSKVFCCEYYTTEICLVLDL